MTAPQDRQLKATKYCNSCGGSDPDCKYIDTQPHYVTDQQSKELEQVVAKAAQSFEKNPITKGTIWQGYLIPQGLMDSLLSALNRYTDKACREAEIKGALFALDNETLWQYQRKCNMGEAMKANRKWLIQLIERNIEKYQNRLATLKGTPPGKDK